MSRRREKKRRRRRRKYFSICQRRKDAPLIQGKSSREKQKKSIAKYEQHNSQPKSNVNNLNWMEKALVHCSNCKTESSMVIIVGSRSAVVIQHKAI